MRERFITARERLFAKSPTLREAARIETELARRVLDKNRPTLVKALWMESKVGVLYTIVEGQEHLDTARKHIAKGRKVLIPINHMQKKVPAITGRIALDHLSTDSSPKAEERKVRPLGHVGAFAGLKHFDSDRGLVSAVQSSIIGEMQKLLGFEIYLVVQDYDKQYYIDHPEKINHQTPRRFNFEAFKKGLQFLREPGHVLLIAPSGTREKDGVLMEAQAGLEALFIQGGDDVLALPISFGPSRFQRIPTVGRVKVRVGKPVSLQEIKEEIRQETGETEPPKGSVGKALMKRLALLLEEKYRGPYK